MLVRRVLTVRLWSVLVSELESSSHSSVSAMFNSLLWLLMVVDGFACVEPVLGGT